MAKRALKFADLEAGNLVRLTLKSRDIVTGWVFSVQDQLESPGIEFCGRADQDFTTECPVHPQNMQFLSAEDVIKIMKL